MLPSKPIIAVVGAGAVGAYYGGRLAQHGHMVHFLLRTDYERVSRNGFDIRSCRGDFTLPPHSIGVHDDPRRMPPADLVIVAIKTTSNNQYEPLIRPLLKDNTIILTLQNGLGNEQRLAELFGPQRILGGLAFVCINRISPGVIHHIDHGLVRIGALMEENASLAASVVELFQGCNIECDLLHSLRYGRWEKLLWNVPFSGLGAVLDMTTDRLIASEWGVDMLRTLMAEVIAAAAADGVQLPSQKADAMINNTLTMGAYRSSMHIDRQLGRPMEVEAILGEPFRSAEKAGVSAPCMGMLYRLASLVNLANLDKARER